MPPDDDDWTAATAVTEQTSGNYTAEVSRAWWVETGPNGGFLAAIIAKAVAAAVDDAARPLRSLTIHYLRSAAAGPVHMHTSVDRTGRTTTSVSVELTQGDRLVGRALAACGVARDAMSYSDVRLPDVPPPEDLPPMEIPSFAPPMPHRLHYRAALGGALFSGAERAELGAWLRLRRPVPVSQPLLATLVDAFPPAAFVRASQPIMAPTIDLTVHFRQLPEDSSYDDWCFGLFRSRTAIEGYFEEDAEIYDRSGRLLAQGRQLGLLLPVTAPGAGTMG